MNWHDFVKKYAWDDERTPYLIRARELTASQAQREIFVYALFLAIFFFAAALAFLAGIRLPDELQPLGVSMAGTARASPSPPSAFYAATVVSAAIWLGLSKDARAAIYCASAPVAAFLYVFNDGLGPRLHAWDKTFLIVFTLLWAWYALRVIAIARGYAHLRQDDPPPPPPG